MTVESNTLPINKDFESLEIRSYDGRESILTNLHEAIETLHHKAINGRVTNPENEKVRIQWFKALAYTCSVYNQIQKDVELDELKDEIKKLQKQIENANRLQTLEGE